MDKKKIIIVWTIYENEGYWYYAFGDKEGALKTSGKNMTKASAQKSLSLEIEQMKRKYGEASEVVTEELRS
jgi:hypothetical protein